jgi:glycosyltransferase involved in cell wall biosynthesis
LKTQTIALLSGGDRFEDFFDKIGVSLDRFRDEFTGGWLFNYIEALRLVGVRTVLIYVSARVDAATRFTHVESGASVWVLPSPRLHKRVRNGQRRFFPESRTLVAAASYLATPLRALATILRNERCDAVLCQEYEQARFDCCVLLGQLIGVPVFARYQGASETNSTLERIVRRMSVTRGDGLIVASSHEIARVKHAYRIASAKIGHIPNPVEIVARVPSVREATRQQLGIGSTTRVVAWHGRVQVRTKGLDVLIDAWDSICSKGPDDDILLLLVGNGRDAGALRQRLACSRKVRWIDRYVFNRKELWSYLLAADLYAITSRREGFAAAVLEAMACGLPAVASDAPGVAEALPRGEADGGIIVPGENPRALADALRRLIDDHALAERLGSIARRRMEQDFSLPVVGQQLRNFLFPQAEERRPD